MLNVSTLNQSLSDLVEKIRPGTVRIRSGAGGFGAGTIWHAEGLILTNAHVLGGNPPVVIFADGSEAQSRVLAQSRRLDLAALSVERSQLPAVELGDSSKLRPGSIVIALGFPWGVNDGATMGVFIGMNRAGGPGMAGERNFIAASLHLRPGHSGGPMVDAAGQLIGINTMMNGPNVGVAIPVDDAKKWLTRALPRKRQASVAMA